MPRPPESDDDAALRWDDLGDPSYSDPALAALAALEPLESDTLTDAGTRPDTVEGAATSGEHPARSSVGMPVVTALGALVFAAYSIAWVVGVSSLPLSGPTLVIEVLYQFAEFLAIIASVLWFGATVVLTRGRLAARAGWLAFGAVVLAPWPFVFAVIG
ncbi:MAG: hypothetical protein Q7J04_08930 [Microcella sp.]|nr:hypothetical protein [Microcella sp.]